MPAPLSAQYGPDADRSRIGLLSSATYPTLTAALVNSELATQGYCRLPIGTLNVDVSIVVPTGAILEGSGPQTLLRATAGLGTGNPVIKSLNTVGATIRNLKVTRDLNLGGDGIEVYGTDITIADCIVDDCIRGLRTTDRTLIDGLQSKRILIENCRVQMVATPSAANSAFGILMSTVDDVTLRDCYFSNNWLDGVKGNRFVTSLKYVGGASYNNGRSSTDAGDGIDMFAGLNSTVLIDGVSFYDNGAGAIGGNGITIKSIHDVTPATVPSNPEWGHVRGVRIVNCYMDNNKGSAIAIEGVFDSVLGATAKLRPRAAQIHIIDCVATNHFNAAYIINSFQTTMSQCTARNSGQQGILVGPEARDVLIDQCLFWGNGATTPGGFDQILLDADGVNAPERIRISNCRFNGKQSTDATANTVITDADYAALTTISRDAIRVENGCTEVYVEDCTAEFHTLDSVPYLYPVRSQQVGVTETLFVRHKGSHGNPNNRIYGGIGSTFQSYATGAVDTTLWMKARGLPSDSTGWVPVVAYQDNGWFGDGTDGDVVISGGTTTLARDMYYNTLQITATGILETAGFRVFVRGNTSTTAGTLGFAGCLTIDASGIMRCNGAAAIGTAGGIAGAAGSVPGRIAGSAGGIAAGTAGTGATVTRRSSAGASGAGGAGAGGAGGAAGAKTIIAAANGDFDSIADIARGATQNLTFSQGGPGGGGGGGDGALAGGGGGAGGGILVVCARTISNNGAIECKGGAGATGPTTNTGGGGGGAGGTAFLVAFGLPGAGGNGNALDMAGGAGGASGGGAGAAGAAGAVGAIIFVRAS